MTKKTLNQNGKYVQELIDTIDPKFIFGKKSINRFSVITSNNDNSTNSKSDQLLKLKEQINSIDNCNLRQNSNNLIMGSGDMNSSIMLIGEAPGDKEDF